MATRYQHGPAAPDIRSGWPAPRPAPMPNPRLRRYSAEPIGAYVTAGDRSRTVASRRVASCVLRMRPGPPQPWPGRRSAVSTLLSCPDAPRRPDLCRSQALPARRARRTTRRLPPGSTVPQYAARPSARPDADGLIRTIAPACGCTWRSPAPRLEPPVRDDNRQRERQDMAVRRRLELHPRRQARSLPAARSRLEMAEQPQTRFSCRLDRNTVSKHRRPG